MTDLKTRLNALAAEAEASGIFTDEARWMRAEGVADLLYEALDRIDCLTSALEEIERTPGEVGRVAFAALAGGCK